MLAQSSQTAPRLAGEAVERFRALEDVAEDIARGADQPLGPEELAQATAALERALAALAAGVDRAAYGLRAPSPHDRRAMGWRLHGLAGALRRCRQLAGAVRDAADRARPAA